MAVEALLTAKDKDFLDYAGKVALLLVLHPSVVEVEVPGQVLQELIKIVAVLVAAVGSQLVELMQEVLALLDKVLLVEVDLQHLLNRTLVLAEVELVELVRLVILDQTQESQELAG
jgi:hypothetical protein